MTSPAVVRWGILATGAISKVFVTDLLLDPKTRGVTDVIHKVVAVGSRSQEKARAFADDLGLGKDTKAYGDYDGVLADENVDIVYIASPNSHHYPNARSALLAGKGVLCEKGFTVNAAQAEDLVRISREKNVYLHEALWTRHFPATIKLQEVIKEGKIGKVHRVLSDYGGNVGLDDMDPGHRLIDPALGGGAILDVGPYSLCWVLVPLFPFPAEPTKPTIVSSITIERGIDTDTTAILKFEGLDGVTAVLTSNLKTSPRPIVIQGSKGTITLKGKASHPDGGFVFTDLDGKTEDFDYPAPKEGTGMFWEADDAARNLLAGKIESSRMTHATSIAGMKIFDEIRAQSGFKYSDELERVL